MDAAQLQEMVKQAAQQDGKAITQLYEEYHNGIYFLCLKIVKNGDDALDLVQDSFLQAFSKLDTLENPAQFGSWLNQIAANKCRDYLKKKTPVLFSQQQSNSEEEEEPEIEDRDESLIPDKALDTEETRRLIMEIIDALPDLQRMTVMMYYYEEKSIKEISEVMECSENTTKSRLNYARKQIREGVLALEKKGTKLYGVMPMLFPIIRHAASDITIPSDTSLTLLDNITCSLVPGSAQGTVSAASTAMRRAVTGFSKLNLPAKIGAGIAAAAVVAGIGLGVSAAAGHSVPVQVVPQSSTSAVQALVSSAVGSATVFSSSPMKSSSANIPSSAPPPIASSEPPTKPPPSSVRSAVPSSRSPSSGPSRFSPTSSILTHIGTVTFQSPNKIRTFKISDVISQEKYTHSGKTDIVYTVPVGAQFTCYNNTSGSAIRIDYVVYPDLASLGGDTSEGDEVDTPYAIPKAYAGKVLYFWDVGDPTTIVCKVGN